MKGWLKKAALIGAAIVTAVSLSACGKQDSNSGKKVTIEYFNQKKEMSSTLKSIIKDFEKESRHSCKRSRCTKCWYGTEN